MVFLTSIRTCAGSVLKNIKKLRNAKLIFNARYIGNEYRSLCQYSVYSHCPMNSFQRNFSSKQSITDIDSDSDTEIPELSPSVSLIRQILCPESEDVLHKQITDCTTVEEVYKICNENSDRLSVTNAAQAVIVLWDILGNGSRKNRLSESESIINTPEFETISKILEANYDGLTVDELTCVLLYLNKLGINLRHDVTQNIIRKVEHCIEHNPDDIKLTALSRYLVSFKTNFTIFSLLSQLKTVTVIKTRLENCETALDLKLITICMIQVHWLLDESVLQCYKQKVKQMLDDDQITNEQTDVLVKIIRYLNLPLWLNENTNLINDLFKVLQNNIKQLEAKEIIFLHKVFQAHLEPACILEVIKAFIDKQIPRTDNATNTQDQPEVPIELLACLVQYSPPSKKKYYEKIALECLMNDFENTFNIVYKILRDSKTANFQLCNVYWSKLTEFVKNCGEHDHNNQFILFRWCQRYMNFNNNLGGTYRHKEFETFLISWLREELDSSLIGVLPSKFAKASSFILAYGNDYKEKQLIIERLIEMNQQFNIGDCIVLSKAMGKMFDLSKHQLRTGFLQYFVDLDGCLNDCSWRLLDTSTNNTHSLTTILKGYIDRNGGNDTKLFHEIINRLSSVECKLSSRLVKDLTRLFHMTDCLVPNLLDNITNYINTNKHDVLTETAQKVLYLCFYLGYYPKNYTELIANVSRMLVRDKNRMSGLNLLEGCLSLCFYHSLPTQLAEHIFTVDFLEKLDDELSLCYSRAIYPVKVRHKMMELNRSVCIDFPELNIPWFHDKYCEEQTVLDTVNETPFAADVRKNLAQVVGTSHVLDLDAYSPYGYKINFQILLDKNKRPVGKYQHADPGVTKIAVILYPEDRFTINVKNLKGSAQLQQRHLEMLGYKVIGITQHNWNSMHMSPVDIKQSALRQQIWPDS